MRTKKAKRYDKQIDREIEKSVAHFSEHLMSIPARSQLYCDFICL